MKSKYLWIMAFCIIVLSGLPMGICAEEAAPDPAAEQVSDEPQEDLTNYAYGTVVKASASEIVLSEYDLATDGDIEVTYKVDSAAELENITAVDQIQIGDSIDIDYLEKDGVKTAVYIAKEEISEDY